MPCLYVGLGVCVCVYLCVCQKIRMRNKDNMTDYVSKCHGKREGKGDTRTSHEQSTAHLCPAPPHCLRLCLSPSSPVPAPAQGLVFLLGLPFFSAVCHSRLISTIHTDTHIPIACVCIVVRVFEKVAQFLFYVRLM